MRDKKEEPTKSAGARLEMAQKANEELERQSEEFFRNVAQRNIGISAEREKFPDGVKTGSYKRLPPNKGD